MSGEGQKPVTLAIIHVKFVEIFRIVIIFEIINFVRIIRFVKVAAAAESVLSILTPPDERIIGGVSHGSGIENISDLQGRNSSH